METSYTPVDINKIQKKGTGLNTVLLSIVTFTALVLAIMLFMLIQKQLSQTAPQVKTIPVVTPSLVPTVIPPEEELTVPSVATDSLIVTETITLEPEPTIINPE